MTDLLAAYDFLAPRQIVFGWSRRSELGRLAAPLGKRAFVVIGSRTLERHFWPELAANLEAAGVEPVIAAEIHREPQVDDVDRAVRFLCERNASAGDWVLGLGGGSAIDLAKAAAALATNRRGASVVEYLEGVGRGLQIEASPLPIVAMPTTGGTGAEATKNAVISSQDPPFKKSLRSPAMVPQLVLVDPELTIGLPASQTAASGMDAITQLIESYFSRFARPIPRAVCIDGLRRALPALPIACREPTNRPAREAMAHAALLSGLALANSGLGMAHGVAAALGSVADVPHGLACAMMLPVALKTNRTACLAELARLARDVLDRRFENDEHAADALVDAIEKLSDEIGIPRRLRDAGVKHDDLSRLVPASHGNSMNGNPREIPDAELLELLEACW